MSAPDETVSIPSSPTPPPSWCGGATYGPCVLSNASVRNDWLTVTSVHEHRAQVKMVCAMPPVQAVAPASPVFTWIGAPPPAHPDVGGIPATAVWQEPPPFPSVTQ